MNLLAFSKIMKKYEKVRYEEELLLYLTDFLLQSPINA